VRWGAECVAVNADDKACSNINDDGSTPTTTNDRAESTGRRRPKHNHYYAVVGLDTVRGATVCAHSDGIPWRWG